MKRKAICLLLWVMVYFVFTLYTVSIYANDEIDIPEPIKIVDFSYSFTDLAIQDENFEVVDNLAKPSLVYDKEMGQVLQLGKEITKDRECDIPSWIVLSDNSEYSTIKLTNPYKGLTNLKECEPYESVETKLYQGAWSRVQPYWKKGITISYWIKAPELVNSNVLGFTSERFQIHADDLGNHLTTYRFDLEYNKYTDEEKQILGYNESGVAFDSDFYFAYAGDKTYNEKPLYVDENELGCLYWMNKYYEPGYILKKDGTYIESYDRDSYAEYNEAPYLGDALDEHDSKKSNLRYGWTLSEMRIDASSSFYYDSDVYAYGDEACNIEGYNVQLNPNHEESFNNSIPLDSYNEFHVDSWKKYSYFNDAYEANETAPSPLSQPNEWHYVTVIIQNDWVRYYLDGKEVDTLNEYSAFNGEFSLMANLWKRFNKGTGSRYGFGRIRFLEDKYNSYYLGYTSPTILDWLVLDCTDMVIGGGSVSNLREFTLMTDEIQIKNMTFYDVMLTDEQINVLADNPEYYSDRHPYLGDANVDNKVSTRDALLVLMHAAKISELESTEYLDVNFDEKIDTEDALSILKYTAKLISSF